MPLASIVLLTKNAEKHLSEVLEAILCQEVGFEYEILAIDSGSSDQTLEILKKHPVRLITIPPETFNHGDTRNLGAKEAHRDSEYIVFLTQDARPYNQSWLQNLVEPFNENPNTAGVFSRHVPRKGASASTARQLIELTQSGGTKQLVKEMPPTVDEYERDKFFYNFFSNTSSAIRHSVWKEIPFEKVDFAEDALWADHVLRRGYNIVFEPTSIVEHSHNYSIIEQFRQNVDHAHAMNQLFKPAHYHSIKNWIKLYAGIPLQVWRDYNFVRSNPFFSTTPLWYKICTAVFSLPWYIATISGSFVGAHLEMFPPALKSWLSRQGRIKSL